MIPLRDFAQVDRTIIAAHRGSSGTAPENTMAALRQALDAGASMVEVDVQFSRDDEAVLLHDQTLERTTNASGSVRTKTWPELRELDAGSWFAPEFSGEHIPLLSEALDFLRGRAYVNIEIKEPLADEDYNARVEKIAAIIQKKGLAPFTLFSSFHHPSLLALKQRFPDLHTAAIQIPGDPRMPSSILAAIQGDAFVCSLDELNDERSEDIARHQIYTGVYTINSTEQLRQALARKVNAVVTNFPGLIARELARADEK